MKAFRSLSAALVLVATLLFGMMPAVAWQAKPAPKASTASSTALVTTSPIWTTIMLRALGHRVAGLVWAGAGVAFVGVLLLTGVDLSLSGRALAGDATPLLRLIVQSDGFSGGYSPPGYFSDGMYFAVGCPDYPQLFPLSGSSAGRSPTPIAPQPATSQYLRIRAEKPVPVRARRVRRSRSAYCA